MPVSDRIENVELNLDATSAPTLNQRKLRAYLGHGQHMVKGWLYRGAAEAIVELSDAQRKAGIGGGVAEIGVHHGKLFILLYLLTSKGEPAVAIDLFSNQELNVDRSGAGDLDRFKQNLRRHADLSRLVVYEGDSTQLKAMDLKRLASGPLRLISIDGGHTAETTAHDLATAESALHPGGVIVLDDCFHSMWPGVVSGVIRFFSQPRAIVPFGIGANKTFFCHDDKDLVGRFQAALKKLDPRAAEKEFLGHSVECFELAPRSLAGWYRKADPWRSIRRAYHDVFSRLSR